MATPPVDKWEYKTCSANTSIGGLNKLGKDGWEMVLIINKEAYPVRCILKRKLPPGEGEGE